MLTITLRDGCEGGTGSYRHIVTVITKDGHERETKSQRLVMIFITRYCWRRRVLRELHESEE
jgi:hypothetical protein